MTFDELMSFHPHNERNFNRIQTKCNLRQLVPFVGAGLSIPPYKGWGAALRSIYAYAFSESSELKQYLDNNKYDLAASYVYQSLGAARFADAFQDEFSTDKITSAGLSEAMKLLPDIFTGLVFTTNYDRCLETSYNQSGRAFNSIYNIRDKNGYQNVIDQMLRGQPHDLFKLHGDIDNPSGRVLLKEEYDDLYREGGPFDELLSTIFTYKTFLFLGCSMSGEDEYMKCLKRVAAQHAVPNFAILPMLQKESDETEEEYRSRTNQWETLLSNHWIFPVFYPDGDYNSVTVLLQALCPKNEQARNKAAIHPTGFYGRKDLVEQIQRQLEESHCVIVSGEGGIGKTQVCEELVSQFPGDAVKVYLQGVGNYISLLQSICNALGLRSVKNENDDYVIKEAILKELGHRSSLAPFLLYLDNFEDVFPPDSPILNPEPALEEIEVSDPSVLLIAEFMVALPAQCKLLVSSRVVLTGFPTTRVEPLPDSSMLFLFERVFEHSGGNKEQLHQEADDLAELVKHLSGLPLAAVLTASQVMMAGSIHKILEMWKAADKLSVNVAIDNNPVHRALITTLRMSYNHIGDNRDAKLLWGYLGLVSQDLPNELAELLLPDTYSQAERCLISLSLAYPNQNGDGLSMLEPIKKLAFSYEQSIEAECLHKLLKVYQSLIAADIDGSKKSDLAAEFTDEIIYFLNYLLDQKIENAYEYINEIYKKPDELDYLMAGKPQSALILLDKLFQNANVFNNLKKEVKAWIYTGCAQCQIFCGLHKQARDNYEMAQKLYEELEMYSKVVGILVDKGKLEYYDNNYANAELLYQEVEEMAKKANDQTLLASVYLSIGQLYLTLAYEEYDLDNKKRNSSTAFDYLNKAQKIAEQDSLPSKSKHYLAHIFFFLGQYYSMAVNHDFDSALACYNEALKLYKNTHDFLGQGNTYADLGDLFFASSPQKARDHYQSALICYRLNEMTDSYCSYVIQRISLCDARLRRSLSIDKLIARIDQKIAELETEEANQNTDTANETSDDDSFVDDLIARIDQKIAELEAEEANHNTDNDDETTDDDYFEDDLNGNTLNIEELVERYKRANGSDNISENGSDTL